MKLLTAFILSCISLSSVCYQVDPDKFSQKFQTHLDSIANGNEFGGMTIGIALPDGEILGFAVGLSNIENGIPMTPDHRMLGGSTGKIFVSAAVMQQVEAGKIQLDKKVLEYLGKYEWFKRVQNAESLTIRNADPDRIWKPAELVAFVFDQEPLFEAGTDFAYSDTNYIILAMVLEEVTGKSMYDYIQSNV